MAGHHLAHGPANRGRRVLQAAAPLFICEPGQSPRGGAVVIHGVRGLTHETEVACRLLARDSWFAVAPLLYHEHGGTVFPESDQARALAELASVPVATLAADLAAAVSYLSGRGIDAPAVIGFGTGGHLAAWAAASLDGVGAAISVAPVTAPGDLPPLPALAAAARVPYLELPAAGQPWPPIRAFLVRQ
jgi:carboxymethylenebutenolidase